MIKKFNRNKMIENELFYYFEMESDMYEVTWS